MQVVDRGTHEELVLKKGSLYGALVLQSGGGPTKGERDVAVATTPRRSTRRQRLPDATKEPDGPSAVEAEVDTGSHNALQPD
jgi:hypothetical protein